MSLSNRQADLLGARLRTGGAASEADLRAYLAFRETYFDDLLAVEDGIREGLPNVAPVGRLKTPASLVAKLQRQPSTRLSQVQDIAGTRLTVTGLRAQDAAVDRLREAFSSAVVQVDDLREVPHYGYRAVHVIVRGPAGRLVEIQVRTALQHLWAQTSEKVADRVDSQVKYGGGPEDIQRQLAGLSDRAYLLENLVLATDLLRARLDEVGRNAEELERLEMTDRLTQLEANLQQLQRSLLESTGRLIEGMMTLRASPEEL